ncbi:hypothetical protein BI364_11650 [Acidihalobacter yilgarnensis]|uniref:Squalene cyclase C-terminal domain-containing protein n=1 Tax=Acidihalobacter yilgarnensis TaxID=2819280 RepID=A0A1D8IPZ5_9GAMM|nr:pectate lyase [Acidihalobacter yilgarnensis]AOU98521.1 hypothetical protein BI364_11650 [Acidihalobacter yilgarnensis]
MTHACLLAWKDRLLPRARAPRARLALDAIADWLGRAQDESGCGGVCANYDLQKRHWAGAYPETTGYIIPTLFNYAEHSGRTEFRDRAIRMADWETEIQLSDGGVRAGTMDASTVVPAIFNTGQVLFGWARAFEETQEPRYQDSLVRASDWLVDAQDDDGAWRRFASPFASHRLNTYNTRTAYGLAVAAKVIGDGRYLLAAQRNVAWALTQAEANGWLPNNCLEDNEHPLTHTIAYALRGILEVSVAAGDARGMDFAVRAAKAVAKAQRPDGALPGRLDRQWRASVSWSCVTGNAQMAVIWLRLAELVGEPALTAAADRAINFNLSLMDLNNANLGIRGGVKGSHPLDGGYMRYRYPNWAAKFFADALMLHDNPASIG